MNSATANLQPELYYFWFEVNEIPKILTNARGNWRGTFAQNKKWKHIVHLHVNRHLPKEPLKKAVLTLTRYSSRCPDADGLCSSFKHCVDGLVEAGVLVDDNMSVIGMPKYQWFTARPGHGKIRIEIQEVV